MSNVTALSLTPAEEALVKQLQATLSHDQLVQELKENLQTAIQIELATIPIYLYTYYSIQRNRRSAEQITPADLFANKAGGFIMSVAVEEMLHMSLSSNILFSMGGDPQLYLNSPGPYPTPLPYHREHGPVGPDGRRKVLIPLSKFSYEQLWHFLQIEYPEINDAMPEDRNWETIGQFYSYIRCLIYCVDDADFQVRGVDGVKYQIQPYNYSPNNIDTAYPTKKFDSWGIPPAQGAPTPAPAASPSAAQVTAFSNAPDSHHGKQQLITVNSKADAFNAIATICDQGEGAQGRRTDDPSRAELTHYYKFLSLQAQLEQYNPKQEQLAKLPPPPPPIKPAVTDNMLSLVVANFPDNPTTASYLKAYYEDPKSRTNYRELSDLVNGIYQYMLILTETIFKVADTGPDGGGQKLYFNKSLHQTMIWILDKLAQKMRSYSLGNGFVVAPTFENIDLGPRQEAYANLMALASATQNTPYYSGIKYYIDEFVKNVPDVSQYWAPTTQAAPIATSAGMCSYKPGEPVPVPYPYATAPTWPAKIGCQPHGLPLHACMGLNSCGASDRFGLAGPADGPNPYKPNQCAGQGYCSTAVDHTCHVKNDCSHQGGCGLYGTAEELDKPGQNDCKALGSCATPINAERFSTNGPNQGKSVWARAREVFKESWEKQNPGQTLGPVPEPFKDTVGPPYLWISDDNKKRDNMTACGASGLSGAGGCA